MYTRHRILGLTVVALTMVAGLTIASSRASADDVRTSVAPAIYRADASSGTPVRTVQLYAGGYYRPYYRPYYYRPYYRPYYYGGYYSRPYYYGGYGYGYPAYGYSYGYPAYGYYGYGSGVGVAVGRVGVGVW